MVRVLVADDSRPFLDAAVAVIEQTGGFELVGTALSGEEAVELASSTRPDLALLDLRMPGMGGLEAGSRIGAASPETKIVLMTADSGRTRGLPTHATIEKRRLSPAVLTAVWASFAG